MSSYGVADDTYYRNVALRITGKFTLYLSNYDVFVLCELTKEKEKLPKFNSVKLYH